MRAAIIENGKVKNVIILDSLDHHPGAVDIGDIGGVGWSYVNGIFSAPPLTDEEQSERAALIAAEEIRQAARAQLDLDKFSDLTYAQIADHIDANVTSLAGARVILKRMARLLKALVDKE